MKRTNVLLTKALCLSVLGTSLLSLSSCSFLRPQTTQADFANTQEISVSRTAAQKNTQGTVASRVSSALPINTAAKNDLVDPGLNPKVLKLAKKAYLHAQQDGNAQKPILTVVDFSLPSNEKRMWILDVSNMKNPKILYNGIVAHGKNSGVLMATHFSNTPRSLQSSLGTFETMNTTYKGKHGNELQLQGLESGINDKAKSRAIIIHSAAYSSNSFIQKMHRAGRSWGCFAVSPANIKRVENLIVGGSIVFAYAAQEQHDPYVA